MPNPAIGTGKAAIFLGLRIRGAVIIVKGNFSEGAATLPASSGR